MSYAGTVLDGRRMDASHELAGERVAVLGTGASAVRLVPELVRVARSVEVFQRSPAWVLPRPHARLPAWARTLAGEAGRWQREAERGVVVAPVAARGAEAAVRAHLRYAVRDPWLRRQLTPSARTGAPRLHFSDAYYPALQHARCKVITWPIVGWVPRGLRTADGIERWFDCVVLADDEELTGRAASDLGRGAEAGG